MTTRASQTFRRYSAVAFYALAGLILSACGGGGEAGAGNSQLDSKSPFSERPSSGDQSDGDPEQAGSGDNSTPGSGDNGVSKTDPDSAAQDDEVPFDETVDSVAIDDGSVTLEWYRPQYRENGELIGDGEIGGYEVRYRQVGAQEPQSIVIDGEWAVEYELEGLEKGEYEFAVAAYDTNGLYSEFVSINPLP